MPLPTEKTIQNHLNRESGTIDSKNEVEKSSI